MRFLFLVLILLGGIDVFGQFSSRELPRNVNRPNTDNFYPVITPDGKLLYYFTNYTNFGDIEVRLTEKVGSQWSNPKDVDPDLFKPNLSHKGSIFITYDNAEVYFGTRKSPTIGGFDINVADNNNGKVSNPRNIGKPVNSPSNEGAPSLTPDGKTIYFMRCASMNVDTEKDCKIYSATRKSSGLWNEPELLPESINQGDTRFPVILPDAETLIFSSDKGGNFDLYLTRNSDGEWSEPVALDFMNTDQNEKRITAPLPGDIIFYSARNEEGKRQLMMARLEDPFKPKDLYMIRGHVFDEGNHPLEASIQAIDASTEKVVARVSSNRESGAFEIMLKEGGKYDFSIFPKDQKHAYYSTLLDLEELERSERRFLDIKLDGLEHNPVILLDELRGVQNADDLSSASHLCVNRLSYLLKENPNQTIEIGAFMSGYVEDSIFVNDLTEFRQDTVVVQEVVEIVDSVLTNESIVRIDSLLEVANDSLSTENIDSLKRTVLSYKPVISYDTVDVVRVRDVYHNDRTESIASKLAELLVAKGIDENRIKFTGYREEYWEGIDFSGEELTQFKVAVTFRGR